MRVLLLSVLALCAAAVSRPASAGSVVVPDDHATITAAIASGADTVRVREGFYDETVTIPRPLLLARFDPGAPRPRIPRLLVAYHPNALDWGHVRGFRVDENVPFDLAFSAGTNLWLDDCVLAAGIARGAGMSPRLRVTDCEIAGSVSANPWSFEFTGNRLAGDLTFSYEDFATVAGNWVTGAPGFGIMLDNHESYARLTDNVVSDCGAGIRVRRPMDTAVERNLVERCGGDAILVDESGGTGGSGWMRANANTIRDVSGDGIVFGHLGGTAIGNVLERIGQAGIRADVPNTGMGAVRDNRISDTGGPGFQGAQAWIAVFAANTILRAGGHGADLGALGRADSNIVGRCRGDGIRVTNLWPESPSARHNTLYLNDGSGLRVESATDGAVAANIAYGNGLYALDWSGAGVATLGCNLAFGNRAGTVRGAEATETDREGDPLFCNLPADDVHLGPGTAAILAGCETAGALGPGCASSAGAGAGQPAAFLRVVPRPASTWLRFEWAPRSAGRIEVFDVAGAKRWERALAAGQASLAWDLRDAAGRRLAPGLYFVRATWDGRALAERLVVMP